MSVRRLQDRPLWAWPEKTGKRLLGVFRDTGAREPDLRRAIEFARHRTVVADERADARLFVMHDGDGLVVDDQAAILRCARGQCEDQV